MRPASARASSSSWAASSSGAVNIAARAIGIGEAAFEASIRYAQEREAFGKPIAQHQPIQMKLAQMATKLAAAELLMLEAAEKKDAGERADLEVGHGEAVRDRDGRGGRDRGDADPRRVRLLDGVPVERLYRDAPLLILGEGSNEIQQLVIARRLLERHRVAAGGPRS